MSKTYKGKYRPENLKKYKGNATNVTYRSLWERQVMRWCDANPNVVWWNSEELVIPYVCKTDKKWHRYFIDFQIKFKKGPIYCIEVKPKEQTKKPERKRGKRKERFLKEVTIWTKNRSKWESARAYCADRGMVFEIWTQDTLESLGIKVLRAAHKRKKK